MANKICKNCSKKFQIVKWRLKDPQRGKYCSILCQRQYHSGERNHYYGRSLKGKDNPNWKGNNVGYVAFHERVSVERGKPKKCEQCGDKSERRYEWASLNKNYDDVNDYIRLCVSCHRKMDGNMPVNRYIRQNGGII